MPYRLSEPAHAVLLVDHRQVEFVRFATQHGVLSWNGKIDNRLARPGNHLLEIAAQDAAGNRSKPFPFAVVTIRYLQLGRTRILARPGGRFAVRVLTDAKTVSWLLERRARGVADSHTLRLRAPAKPGVYRLYVTAAGPHGEGAGGRRVTAELARIGGPVGALGLAVLVLGTGTAWRIAGLVAWAAGCATLAVWLAPSGHHRAYAAAAVVGAVAAALLAWLFVRVPWLLAVAVLACAPARIPVSVGSTKANLLLPLYVVVAGGGARARLGALRRRAADARARAARVAAGAVRRLVGARVPLVGRPPAGRDLPALLRAAVRAARRLARRACPGGSAG